jgi:acyl carrier protein
VEVLLEGEIVDREQMVTQLESVLEVGPGSLQDEDEVRNLEHWDSLKLLEIIALADDQFHVELDADRLAGCAKIGDILRLLENAPAVKDLKSQVQC